MRYFCALVPLLCLAAGPLATGALAMPKDCSTAQIPDTPVRGTVNGKPFVPNAITVHITKNGMRVDEAKFDRYELVQMLLDRKLRQEALRRVMGRYNEFHARWAGGSPAIQTRDEES